MNKIEGLKTISELGFPVYKFLIYGKDDLSLLDRNSKYLVRKSLKNSFGQVNLGVYRNLSYDELINVIKKLKDQYDLIIGKEINIDYYGNIVRFISNGMNILCIEIFDNIVNRNAGIYCDRLEYHYIDNHLIERIEIPRNNFFKYLVLDLEKIVKREYQMEFIISNNDILYTDFDIIEKKEKVYGKHLFW